MYDAAYLIIVFADLPVIKNIYAIFAYEDLINLALYVPIQVRTKKK